MNKFLSLSILQVLGINNVNRDDLGNVKSAVYGGAIRQRVSSQCWKKFVRDTLHELTGYKSYRSQLMADKIYADLVTGGMAPADAVAAIGQVFAASKKIGKLIKDYKTIVEKGVQPGVEIKTECLIFYSQEEYALILNACRTGTVDKDIQDIILSAQSRFGAIVSLFGRMMADHTSLNVEAASSFAHAFSTHEIAQESDYFTAKDDLSTGSGAGHLNQTSFTQSTVYRHITLDVDQLRTNLVGATEDEIREVVSAFFKACVIAFPTGKSHSLESRTLPSFVKIDSTNLPISMCGAFEKPVAPGVGGGFLESSVAAFEAHYAKMVSSGYIVDKTYGGSAYSIDELGAFAASCV
jgi:CRISPR system Cascade subunit CasC